MANAQQKTIPESKLDLRAFKFPNVRGVDIAFPTFNTDPVLLAEARARGFYNGNTKYNDLFSSLFYSGGKLNFKADLPEQFKKDATSYLRAFMGSFAPKHEEKEAICAMLLSELVTA